MTDCDNDTLKDQLPLLAHDALGAEETARVRAHLATCASCAAEFELLGAAKRVFDAEAPAVDTSAIIALLPSAPQGRPVLRVERSARRRAVFPRYAFAAAASLILVATLSLGALRAVFFGGTGADSLDIALVEPGSAATTADILGAGGLSELGSDELTTLLAELEAMEATVAAEPSTIRQPVTTTPEGI